MFFPPFSTKPHRKNQNSALPACSDHTADTNSPFLRFNFRFSEKYVYKYIKVNNSIKYCKENQFFKFNKIGSFQQKKFQKSKKKKVRHFDKSFFFWLCAYLCDFSRYHEAGRMEHMGGQQTIHVRHALSPPNPNSPGCYGLVTVCDFSLLFLYNKRIF